MVSLSAIRARIASKRARGNSLSFVAFQRSSTRNVLLRGISSATDAETIAFHTSSKQAAVGLKQLPSFANAQICVQACSISRYESGTSLLTAERLRYAGPVKIAAKDSGLEYTGRSFLR